MNADALTLSEDEFNAKRLARVMSATARRGETANQALVRCAEIMELFRTLAPASPIESMIACDCIRLQFLLDDAMTHAADETLEPAMAMRARAAAVTISKNLHLWLTKYENRHKHQASRAIETRQRADESPAAQTRKPVPAAAPPAETPPGPTAAEPPAPPPRPILAAPVTAARTPPAEPPPSGTIAPPVSNGQPREPGEGQRPAPTDRTPEAKPQTGHAPAVSPALT